MLRKKKFKRFKKIRKRKVWDKTTIGTSKLETIFHAFLLSIGIPVETQFQLGWKFFDFKIKDKNILIELHGSYWHGSPELYKKNELNLIQKKNIMNDSNKLKLATKHGYKVIYIWEHEFNKNKPAVKVSLLEQINSNI